MALTSCRAEPGHTYACTCSYLTDFDDGAKTDVSVCAPTPERAADIARGCAQSAAPAPIQTCTCTPSASACERRGCR